MQIAILEDNPGVGKIISLYLEYAGYTPFAFNNAKDFFNFITDQTELIIVDYCLETDDQLNGVDAIRKVREIFPDMPAIIISALPRLILAEAAKGLANVHIKQKPFKMSDLVKTIEMMTNK